METKGRNLEPTLNRYEIIPLNEIQLAPWNYKIDDADRATKLAENIRRNGQVVNINIRPLGNDKYECIDGNHRIPALKMAGYETAICYNHGDISMQDAQRLAIELNETRFETDRVALANILSDLSTTYDLKDLESTLPYTAIELEDFFQLTKNVDELFADIAAKEKETQGNLVIKFTITVSESDGEQLENELNALVDKIESAKISRKEFL